MAKLFDNSQVADAKKENQSGGKSASASVSLGSNAPAGATLTTSSQGLKIATAPGPAHQAIPYRRVVQQTSRQESSSPTVKNTPTTSRPTVQATIKIPNAPTSTNRGMLANIDYLNKTDRLGADELYTDLKSQWGDYNSAYSRPYSSVTNKSKVALDELGIDYSNINQEWYDQYAPYLDYLPRSTSTNNYSTPTKRQLRNPAVKLGNAVRGFMEVEDFTVQAETEYAQLQKDIEYLVKDPHHYSPDKIVQMLDIPNNYKALAKMDEGRTSREPVELNRAVNYNGEDDLYTLIYQAMNGSSGNYLRDMINSGYDGWWQEDPEIAAKAAESPYSVGMVSKEMEDAGRYFGQYSFSWDWYNENYDESNTDPDYVQNMKRVYAALENSDEIDKELAKLDEHLERKLKNVYSDEDVDRVLKGIPWEDYDTLVAIDKSLGKDGKKGNFKWVPTARAVDYKYQDIVDRLNAAKEENSKLLNGDDTVAGFTPPAKSEETPATTAAETQQTEAPAAETQQTEPAPEDPLKKDYHWGQSAPTWNQEVAEEEVPAPADANEIPEENITGKGNRWGLPTVASSGTIPTASPETKEAVQNYQPPAKTGTQLTEDVLNGKVKDAYAVLEGSMTDKERAHFDAIPGVEYGRIVLGMEKGPLNPQLWQDPNFKEYNFRKAEANTNNAYKKTALETLATRREYEGLQDEAEKLHTEINKTWETYGDKIYATAEVPEDITFLVYPEYDIDGAIWFNDETNQYEIYPVEDNPGIIDKLNTYGISLEEYNAEAAKKAENSLAYVSQVQAAKEKYGDDLPEGMPTLEEVTQATNRLNNIEQQLEAGKEGYDAAVAELETAQKRQQMMSDLLLKAGLDVESVSNIDAVISAVEGIAGFQAPEATTSTLAGRLYREARFQSDKSGQTKEIANAKKEIDEAIADANWLLNNIGDAPAEYKESIQRYIDYLSSQRLQYDAYEFSQSKNFDKYVEKGKQIEKLAFKDQKLGFTITDADDYEQRLYYGILGAYGQEEADRYYNDIEPTLLAATEATINANTKEMAQSGWLGRVINMGLAVVEAPLDVLGSALDLMSFAATGEGNEWFRTPAKISQSAYSATQAEIAEVYKDQPMLQKAISLVNEMVYNRGRSAVVGGVFGPLFPAGTGEVWQAMPIALTAADETFNKYIDAGVDPTKAAVLSTIAFLSESVTEGIELGHIKEAFGVGKDITKNSLVTFFKDYIPNALPEIVGESLNDIAEKMADYWIAGDKGDLQTLMQSYIDQGMSEDEAYEMMMRDQIADVAHTAFISLLSPILDLGPLAAGEIMSYIQYASEARQLRNSGANPNATVRSLRKGHADMIRAAQNAEEAFALREPGKMFANEPKIIRPDITTNGFSEAAQETNTAQYDQTITVLDGLKNSNPTATAAGISTALKTSDADSYQAGAAAAGIDSILGEDAIGKLQDLFYGGFTQNININILKKGIQFAVNAAGRCNSILTSDSFQNADPETQAQWLASAVAEDAQNQSVQDQVAEATHEFRVNEEEKRLMSEGAGDAAVTAKENIQAAKEETEAAKDELEKRSDDVEAKQEAARVAGEEAANNPTDENVNEATKATNELSKSVESEDQYQQHLDKTERQEQETKAREQRKIDETAANIRQQAEATVRQQEEAEAKAAAEAAVKAQEEQARLRAEQEAKAKEEAEKSKRALIEKARSIGEEKADQKGLQGEEREAFVKRFEDRAEQIVSQNANMDASIVLSENGDVTNAEGILALRSFAGKTGLQIQFKDLGDPTVVRGRYDKGVVTLNSRLVNSGSLTTGQALIEAALHEFTHAFENTKSYKNYSRTVIDILYGKGATAENNSNLAADIRTKIEEYHEGGADLTLDGKISEEEGALREIVADYARTEGLANRDSVQRFIDAGLGSQMRNALHNINQAIKNFRLTGEEKIQAENLRRAERAYQKALDEMSRKAVHPEGGQFSISQFAQAAGMEFNPDTLELYDSNGNLIDGINNKVTPDMIRRTPVGMLIDLAENGATTKKGNVKFTSTINPETAQAQRQMFADLMNMVAQYKDSDLVWEIASSTLFSAMKANSDPQYSTTVDFGTVCAKTQEIINVMSKVMLEKGRGLTRSEVLKVYNETANAGLTVPCPVCYVFSRWMGVPSLLNQMSQFQKRFVALNEDGSINPKKTNEAAQKYINDALEKGDKEGIDKAKQSAMNRLKTQEKNRTNALNVLNSETTTQEEKDAAQKKHDDAIAKMDDITKELSEVEAYNWVTQALCKETKKGYEFDEKGFQLTPDSVLFDLRQTGEFAKYTKNWTYRNTRGAGMGKAIMPYSGETIGDIIYGTERKSEIKNPFLTMMAGKASDGIKNAIARARKQNLIGGQRLQSTSDFRPEWGLDYMMAFLELQAVGSKVQMYTKVAEAVDLLASMGGDINCSIMGSGSGYHEASAAEIAISKQDTPEGRELLSRMGELNGKTYVLDFSDVTGMDYNTAKALKNKYSNVQPILVGMNDIHIQLALANPDIDFVIPWHASGNSKDVLASMISSVGETLEASSDYTDTQSDQESENQTEDQKKLWDLRMKILQGSKITAEERRAIYADDYLVNLYERFNVEGKDADCYQVKLGKDQAGQIFPYEYWDKSLGKVDADENGRRFVEYCQHFGLVPRFSGVVKHNDDGSFTVTGNFAGAVYDENGNITGYDPSKMAKGYWKTLIDRSMYDNDGNYREQQTVDVTKAKIGSLDENGHLVDSDMPLKTSAMYGPNYSKQEKNAVDNTLAALDENAGINGGQSSVFGETTDADIDQMLADADADYQSAVERGDMDAAANDVFFAAERAGFDVEDIAYHGTDSFGFTEFDMDASQNEIFVSYNSNLAATYARDNPETREISSTPAGRLMRMTNEELVDLFNERKMPGYEYNYNKVLGLKESTDNPGTFELEGELTITYLNRTDVINLITTDIYGNKPSGIYEFFTRPGRQLVIDADGSDWNAIPFDLYGSEITSVDWEGNEITEYTDTDWDENFDPDEPHSIDATTREIARWAKAHGYDSVRINNVYDNGGMSGSFYDGYGDIGIFFNQEDVKSADTVTYDDHDNVIPLSERFNNQNSDIRYSIKGKTTQADIDQMIAEYMRPFAEQLHDFAPKETRQERFKDNSLLVGGTPKLLQKIGFPALPVAINQEHLGYALDGTYPNVKYRAGHIFPESELAKLPEKIASPVAITSDPRSTKQFTIYIDMVNTEGDKVIVPLRVGANRQFANKKFQTNTLLTVFEQNDGEANLISAILNDTPSNHSLLYLDKEKALNLDLAHDNITIVREAPSGINHIINAEGSLVNTEIKKQTDTRQFKDWFGDSKVVDEDKKPLIVYHGTSEQFTAFDMSKGRANMDIQGAFFSPYKIDAEGYGENVGAYYLSIKNPASEDQAYAALNRYKGQNEAGIKARKYLESQGYDGVYNGYDEYIAFYPEQIKSATDNIGLFDMRNPDYRYSIGGNQTDADIDQILAENGIIAQDESVRELNQGMVDSGEITKKELDEYRRTQTRAPLEGQRKSMSTDEGTAVRAFAADNGMLSQSDELDALAKAVVMAKRTYFPDTNADQVIRALKWVRSLKTTNNSDGYAEALQAVARPLFDYRSADGQARMVAVMGLAAAKNDVTGQTMLADAFMRQGTDLGRALQARKLFKLMTPEGRISTLMKMLNNQQEILDAKGINKDLKFSEWIYMAAAAATEDGDFQKVQEAAAEELSEQLPASWKDKLRAWRMLSMLGNPRTHIRNIVGNALFIPAVSIKNKLGAVAELGMKQGTRTKTLNPFLSKEVRDFARRDAITMKDELTGEAKYKENPKVQAEPFHGLLKVLSDFNSNRLEGEDWFFLKGHYRRALGGWIQANGYTIEQLQSNPELLEQGRAYAINEAQKATYRDFNGLAAKLNELTRNPKTTWQKALAFGVEAVLPFKKTPANILKRGLEYSPVGIARSLTTDLYHLNQYLKYQKGELRALPEKAISPNQFIDRLCSGLTGSGILMMGAFLANMGVASCGLGDDDDEFEKIKGNQKYAIKFNLLGQDVTLTMDWAAPMSMPFFVGAAIQNMSRDEKGFSIDALVNAFGNIAEPVFNLSMLDGVNSLLKVSQSDKDALPQIGAKILTNYATSYIPSFVGAVARTYDDTSRKAFVESGKGSGVMGTVRYAYEQTQNKIPGWSQSNIPVRDVWGNAKKSGLAERILENFVLPGYIEQYKEDPVTNAMASLFDQTGEPDVIPKDPAKTFSAGGQKYVLSAEQWDTYKTVRGQTAYEGLSTLIQTDEYQNSSTDAKVKMVKTVWDYANEKGKLAVDPTNKSQRITVNYSEMDKALDMGDYETYETMVEALRQDGVEDSSIKTRIGNKYRDQYKDAYRNGNYERMYEIEDILDASGFSFKTSDWEKAVDKEQD